MPFSGGVVAVVFLREMLHEDIHDTSLSNMAACVL